MTKLREMGIGKMGQAMRSVRNNGRSVKLRPILQRMRRARAIRSSTICASTQIGRWNRVDFGLIFKFASRPFLTGLFDFDFSGRAANSFPEKEMGTGVQNPFKYDGLGEVSVERSNG